MQLFVPLNATCFEAKSFKISGLLTGHSFQSVHLCWAGGAEEHRCIAGSGGPIVNTTSVTTGVQFDELSSATISAYIETGEGLL